MASIAEHEVVLALLRDEHARGVGRDRLAFAVGTRMHTLAMQTLDTLDDKALFTEEEAYEAEPTVTAWLDLRVSATRLFCMPECARMTANDDLVTEVLIPHNWAECFGCGKELK